MYHCDTTVWGHCDTIPKMLQLLYSLNVGLYINCYTEWPLVTSLNADKAHEQATIKQT